MRRKWEKIMVTDGKHIYNLMVDKKKEFVSLIRNGDPKLYFVPDNLLQGEIQLSMPQIKIIDAVKQNPGITQIKIAEMLRMRRQNINYHIMQLVEMGMIELQGKGRETYCYVGSGI